MWQTVIDGEVVTVRHKIHMQVQPDAQTQSSTAGSEADIAYGKRTYRFIIGNI